MVNFQGCTSKTLSSQAVALSGKERWMVAPLGARKRIVASEFAHLHEVKQFYQNEVPGKKLLPGSLT